MEKIMPNNSDIIIWTDNNEYKIDNETSSDNGDITEEQWNKLKKFQNIDVNKLIRIPEDVKANKNNEDIFWRKNDKILTTNWVGVISVPDIRLEIHSRFDVSEKQYFLLYLISTYYDFTLYNCNIESLNESIFDLILVILFCEKIQEAYNEGLYKVYKTFKHNDFNFKGYFDVARHIKCNVPFIGKTAYNTREYSYDNDILCMIRQTFEFIKGKYYDLWSNYCKSHSIMYEIENVIEEATPSFQMNIKYQQKPKCHNQITHPMFQDYEKIRQICLRLLKEEGDNIYEEQEEESFGLLIDISWLWENFIAVKLLDNYEHFIPQKSSGIEYTKDKRKWYPDFIEKFENGDRRNVFDAKYKKWNYNNDDMHQLLSYLYITGGNKCGIIYPVQNESDQNETIGNLILNPFKSFYGEEVGCYKIPFTIPNESHYNEFCEKMECNIKMWREEFPENVKESEE